MEDYHGKSERRVKQELYAHFVLVTLARIFECQAEELLPENLIGTFKNESQTGNSLKSVIKLPEDPEQYTSSAETDKSSSKTQVKSPDSQQSNTDNNLEKAKILELEKPINIKRRPEKDDIKTQVKLNFKNCLLVLQRAMEHLFLLNSIDFVNIRVPKILKSIVRLRQTVRPDRHYPRISRKPLKRHKFKQKKEVQFGAVTAAPG